MVSQPSDNGAASLKEFDNYLTIAHYLAICCACKHVPQLVGLATKVSVSLLRYTDVIPADRAFYEAGQLCRVSM